MDKPLPQTVLDYLLSVTIFPLYAPVKNTFTGNLNEYNTSY